jgi:hypothetical protein
MPDDQPIRAFGGWALLFPETLTKARYFGTVSRSVTAARRARTGGHFMRNRKYHPLTLAISACALSLALLIAAVHFFGGTS